MGTQTTALANLEQDLEKVDSALLALMETEKNKERFVKSAYLAVRDNDALLTCDRNSLLGVIIKSAQLKLELNTPEGLAYIIPYKGKATFQIGYKGFMRLAYLSKRISVFEAEVVCDKDEFYYERGLEPILKHIPSEEVDKGLMTHVYAICRLSDGSSTFVVMSKKEIEAIRVRSASAGASFSPWKSDYDMMAKKTVLKRLAKYIPAGSELAVAIEVDGRYEAGYISSIDARRVNKGDTDLTQYSKETKANGSAPDKDREDVLMEEVQAGIKKATKKKGAK